MAPYPALDYFLIFWVLLMEVILGAIIGALTGFMACSVLRLGMHGVKKDACLGGFGFVAVLIG
jgi:hypothetical protein